jgi:hypothetical protein
MKIARDREVEAFSHRVDDATIRSECVDLKKVLLGRSQRVDGMVGRPGLSPRNLAQARGVRAADEGAGWWPGACKALTY